jgi:hypothetical protein
MAEGDMAVIGEIVPPDDENEPPSFRIIKHDFDVQRAGPGVRPCSHGPFVLDEKWSTVTCGKCGQHVPPFNVLLRWAEWDEMAKRRRMGFEDAEKRLHREELRRLSKLRVATDEHRAEIAKALGWSSKLTGQELGQLAKRIRDEQNAIKYRSQHPLP